MAQSSTSTPLSPTAATITASNVVARCDERIGRKNLSPIQVRLRRMKTRFLVLNRRQLNDRQRHLRLLIRYSSIASQSLAQSAEALVPASAAARKRTWKRITGSVR